MIIRPLLNGIIAVLLLLSMASAQARHLHNDQAQHSLQWQERTDFLSHWLEGKQRHPNEPVKSLLEAHTIAEGDLRFHHEAPKGLLTLKEIDLRWLRQAIVAYQRRDWEESRHSLSQLSTPLDEKYQPVAALLTQITSIQMDETPDQPRTELTQNNPLTLYNQALMLVLNQRAKEAEPLVVQLETLIPKNSRAFQQATLLKALILADQGRRDESFSLLLPFTDKHPLAFQANMIRAQGYLLSGDPQAAINLLLELLNQMPNQRLNYFKISLFNLLERLGAQSQASILGSRWLLPLQQQYIKIRSDVLEINSLESLRQFTNEDSSSDLLQSLSQTPRLLLTEMERVNLLMFHLQKQIQLADKTYKTFSENLSSLDTHIQQYPQLLPRSKPPEQLENASPEIKDLEARLSDLVGRPEPWERRYEILDGLAVWHNGEKFKNSWWRESDNNDLNAALGELSEFSAQRLSQTSLLEEVRIEERLPELLPMVGQAHEMLGKLSELKLQLIDAINKEMKTEAQHMIFETEKALLWLSASIAPQAPQFDKPEAQNWFNSRHNPIKSLPAIDKLPFELAASALTALKDNAISPIIRQRALKHLADLTLLISERILNGDDINPRPGISSARASQLYQELLDLNDPETDRQQVFYQLAKAHELAGQPQGAVAALEQLVQLNPEHPLISELWFRIGELHFSLSNHDLAAQAYGHLLIHTSDNVAPSTATQTPSVQADNSSPDEFTDKARYKLAWSFFKMGEYQQALNHFFFLIEAHWPAGVTGSPVANQNPLLDDILRVTSLTFAHMNGVQTLEQYFVTNGQRPFALQLYLNLGTYYEDKHRFHDTAQTFNATVEAFPDDPDAPIYQSRVVSAYIDGGFPSRAGPAREDFISRFGVDSRYWKNSNESGKNVIRGLLATYLIDLAKRDHALGQNSNEPATKQASFNKAIGWYNQFLSALPGDIQIPEVLFLKAEALTELGQHEQAAEHYQIVAYQHPEHTRAAESGYAALLSFQALYQAGERADFWLDKGITESQRFSRAFPDSIYTARLHTKLAEDLLIQNSYAAAIDAVIELLGRPLKLDTDLKIRLWQVRSQAHFELQDYESAELAYLQLRSIETAPEALLEINLRLAESIFKQGEQAKQNADFATALAHFHRLGEDPRYASIMPEADLEAITVLMTQERWDDAIAALERYRTQHPGHKLQETIDDKLVLVYEKAQRWELAALVLQRIFEKEGSSPLGRDALWRSAELQEKAERPKDAILGYQRFIETFPAPHEPAMEARLKLASLAEQLQDQPTRLRWLQAIVAVESQATELSTDRSLFIASEAAMTLSKMALADFASIELTLPLEKSLPKKRNAMEESIKHLTKTNSFGLSLQSTEATLLLGKLYQQFAKSLMASQRPTTLNKLQLEQYDILLQDEALPFEDKAIELHEINVSRIKDEIYTDSIARSLDELKRLLPGRYNKPELAPQVSHEIQ